ncbi:MAG: glycosyltransferase family 4 protein [Verrucomicrobiaceae bacterium]|nr:glycosyltransferase family 4 protein [Verrucomicrobiaceae bacterium]
MSHKKVLFIQPFSVGAVGGGPQILKSVVKDAPCEVTSICTAFCERLPEQSLCPEYLVPLRPRLGRLDRTRFAHLGGYMEAAFVPFFTRRLSRQVHSLSPDAVHLVPHSWGDFVVAHRLAVKMGVPVHVSVHDDLGYTAARHPMKKRMMRELGALWRGAATRFVICEEMGQEYNQRYGFRPYLIHTDGVSEAAATAYLPPAKDIRVYFMGMMNQPYVANVRVLEQALEIVRSTGRFNPSLTLRTQGLASGHPLTTILPFASKEVVEREMADQHLLYLPLPFGKEFRALGQLGFSTKMISYLASGMPIMYHGPDYTAAGRYLERNEGALCIHTNDAAAMAEQLLQVLSEPMELARLASRGVTLANRDFNSHALKQRFWGAVLSDELLTRSSSSQ